VRELAGHLEEVYENLTGRGESSAAAERQALAYVSDWIRLRKKLERARGGDAMRNQQIRSVWLPGLLSTFVGFGLLRAILALGAMPWWILQARLSDLFHATFIGHEVWLFVIPWLAVLPLAGAVGAFASWRAGGRPGQRVVAAQFPVLVIFGLVALNLLIELVQPSVAADAVFARIFSFLIPWVVLPGISLLIGALPFARRSPPSPQPA
jgi:hypothetical protein